MLKGKTPNLFVVIKVGKVRDFVYFICTTKLNFLFGIKLAKFMEETLVRQCGETETVKYSTQLIYSFKWNSPRREESRK